MPTNLAADIFYMHIARAPFNIQSTLYNPYCFRCIKYGYGLNFTDNRINRIFTKKNKKHTKNTD